MPPCSPAPLSRSIYRWDLTRAARVVLSYMSGKPALNVGPSNPIYRWILRGEQESKEASLPIVMSRLRGAAPPLASLRSQSRPPGGARPLPPAGERPAAPSRRRKRAGLKRRNHSTESTSAAAVCEIAHRARCRRAVTLPGPVSTDPHNAHMPPDSEPEPLVATCRELSRLLGQVRPSPTLRAVAPGLIEALPLAKALVLGVEDLVDRVALIEAAIVASIGSPAPVLCLAETARHKRP